MELTSSPPGDLVEKDPGILEDDHFSSRGASFKSLTSYASFRSCRTYKSMGGVSVVSRASYKSCVSRKTSKGEVVGTENLGFYDCKEDDNGSFCSVKETDDSFVMQQSFSNTRRPSEINFDPKKEEKRGCGLFLGYLYCILAGITFTASNAFLQVVPHLEPWTLLVLRCLVQLVVMCPLMLLARQNPFGPPGQRLRVYTQGLGSGALILAIFLSIQRLPTGDVSAIFYAAPVLTMLLSSLVLSEHFRAYRILISLVFLAGVLLSSQPSLLNFEKIAEPVSVNGTEVADLINHDRIISFTSYNMFGWPVNFNKTNTESGLSEEAFDWIGTVAAIAVPILTAFLAILTRQSRDVDYSVMVFWNGIGGLLVSGVGVFTLGSMTLFTETEEWVLAILIAGLGVAGNVLMVKGISMVNPGKAMILRSTELVTTYTLQICILSTLPFWLSIVGVCLVVVAILLMGIEDLVMKKVNSKFV